MEVSPQQLEDEVQEQLNLLCDIMCGDHIVITNHQNTSQFLPGTHWVSILGQRPVQPVINLVQLPKTKDTGTKDCIGEYPALSTFVERYIESLSSALYKLPTIFCQWLSTTHECIMSLKHIRGTYPYPHRAAFNTCQLQGPHQNVTTLKKYSIDGTKLLLMALRCTIHLSSEDQPLAIHFLPSQERAACMLHDIFHNQTYNKVDESEANSSIQHLFSSLFFPPDNPTGMATEGGHSVINCFFLATNLKENGCFNAATAVTPKITHINFILQFIASKELADSAER